MIKHNYTACSYTPKLDTLQVIRLKESEVKRSDRGLGVWEEAFVRKGHGSSIDHLSQHMQLTQYSGQSKAVNP